MHNNEALHAGSSGTDIFFSDHKFHFHSASGNIPSLPISQEPRKGRRDLSLHVLSYKVQQVNFMAMSSPHLEGVAWLAGRELLLWQPRRVFASICLTCA